MCPVCSGRVAFGVELNGAFGLACRGGGVGGEAGFVGSLPCVANLATYAGSPMHRFGVQRLIGSLPASLKRRSPARRGGREPGFLTLASGQDGIKPSDYKVGSDVGKTFREHPCLTVSPAAIILCL